MTYATTISLDLPWHEAVVRTKEALAEQGFGILSEIDVRATFESKLGEQTAADLGDYVILGACNPALANRALTTEPDLGLLLPCNVVVRRAPGSATTIVQAIDPQTMVQLSGSAAIGEVASDAAVKLDAALARLEGAADRSS